MQQIGRYAIFDEIASGGMATVHLARLAGPLGFSRVVAAKRLHPHLLDDDDFKQMFLEEARLAARIRHPNVVPTLDVLVSDREIILVMEYIHGESLSALHRAAREKQVPVPLPIAAAILVSALHGLHAAHEATSETGQPLHIVHRDVSPQNVLVGPDGAVRLLDFGVAKAMQARLETRPGTIKGKFSYMAPEVLRGEALTRQADIFAAAVVFWELVTGRKLFGGANEHERMLKIMAGNYPAPSTFVHDLPGVVDRIVMKALQPDAQMRYRTALEMAVEVEMHLAPASQRVVGEWVKTLAGKSLDERAELLQQIEVSHIHSVPPLPPTGDADEDRTRRITGENAQSEDELRMLAAFGAPAKGTRAKSRRGIVIGAVTGLAVAVLAFTFLHTRGTLSAADGHGASQAPPAPVAAAAQPAPPPTVRESPTPVASAASQDPTLLADAPSQQTADGKASQPRAQNAHPARPAAPARRAPARSTGDARSFLPSDL
jgi:serine/threonine-protein kinase